MQTPMLQRVKQLFSRQHRDAQLQASLERLRQRTPVPVFWLFGKTQSGKTYVVRFLTGADDAEIGQGFKPCTRYSRQYQFPTADAPLLTFLDTRGLDEPGYDPQEDCRHSQRDRSRAARTSRSSRTASPPRSPSAGAC